MNKILFPFIGLAALVVLFLIFGRGDGPIEAVKPIIGAAVQAVYATGTVEPTVMMPIAPRNPARLMKLLADEGQEVSKGQVLAELEAVDLQKQLQELLARADLAEKDYNRRIELAKRGAVSKEAAEQAEADLEVARAAVEGLRAQLDYYKLLAPEEGVVIRRDGETGELISANQPVFWLSCCAPLRVSAEVDEEDIALVKTAQVVLIRADAFPGKTFNGKVTSITPKGDAVARSYRVRIALDGETPLMTGMTAETNIVIKETKDALLVPVSAVMNESLWVVKDGKLEKRVVETGAKSTNSIEIRSGITTDDVVIKKFQPDYIDGQKEKVKVTDWKL